MPLGLTSERWFVDPEMAEILRALEGRPAPDLARLSLDAARAAARAAVLPWNAPPVADVAVEDGRLELPGRTLGLRRFTPRRGSTPGVVLYVHGGGWVTLDLDTHSRAMALIAAASGARVIGLDYRRAPDCAFPGPMLDVADAAVAIVEGALALGGGPLALAGDGAGANLALGALLELKARGGPALAGAALFNGDYAHAPDTPSQHAFGDGRFGPTTRGMSWFWTAYLGEAEPDPRAEPLTADLADLADLPPLYVATAGLDPMRDDGEALVVRLERAGVAVAHRRYPGVTHGFLQYSRSLAAARRAIADGGAALREMLAGAA